MSANQNTIDKEFTPEQLAALDAALDTLEGLTADVTVLDAAGKARLPKPPEGGGDWVDNMFIRAQQNLHLLSRSFDPAAVQRDIALESVLLPRQLRLQRVCDKFDSTRLRGRSDAFRAMLDARRQLLDAGVAGVDDNLSEGLQRYFSRQPAEAPPTPKPA
jgi:hypothetical protein